MGCGVTQGVGCSFLSSKNGERRIGVGIRMESKEMDCRSPSLPSLEEILQGGKEPTKPLGHQPPPLIGAKLQANAGEWLKVEEGLKLWVKQHCVCGSALIWLDPTCHIQLAQNKRTKHVTKLPRNRPIPFWEWNPQFVGCNSRTGNSTLLQSLFRA